MNTHDLSFYTEYHQFYVLDAETKSTTDADDFWNADADNRRLAIGEGLLGVTVAKYAEIQVEVWVLDEKTVLNEKADHIVEASMRLPSGILQVKNCTGYETQLELPLEKDTYRIRISSFKLNTVNNDVGEDYYSIEIWKSRFAKPKIIKAWKG